MEQDKLAKFFPGDHFVHALLMLLIKDVIKISGREFISPKPHQMVMGAVIYLLTELKWVKRYDDRSCRPAWVATRKGCRALMTIHRDLLQDATFGVRPQAEDLAEAVAKVEAEVEAEVQAAIEADRD
jgi:hypothetical protein